MLARLRKAQENNEGGFTLIELLVVMIIIGILAAIAIPAFLNQKNKAKETSAKSDATNISKEFAAALVDGPFDTATSGTLTADGNISYNTTIDSANVNVAVKVTSGNTVTYSTSVGEIYSVTVCPASGSPWTASNTGLVKGGTCGT